MNVFAKLNLLYLGWHGFDRRVERSVSAKNGFP